MRLRTCAVLTGLMLAGMAGPAWGQAITIIDCKPLIGISAGPTMNGDHNGARGAYPRNTSGQSPDLSASVEVPLIGGWNVRGDVGSTAWTFQSHDPWGVPLVRDRVRITRATAAAIKRVPRECGYPYRLFGGIGAGAYRYDFRDAGVRTTQTGIFGLLGMDAMINERLVLTTSLAIDAIGGPSYQPIASDTLFTFRFTWGLRLTF